MDKHDLRDILMPFSVTAFRFLDRFGKAFILLSKLADLGHCHPPGPLQKHQYCRVMLLFYRQTSKILLSFIILAHFGQK